MVGGNEQEKNDFNPHYFWLPHMWLSLHTLSGTTSKMYIRGTARWRLKFLNEESEYVEIPREKYERLKTAIEEMNTPYHSAPDFINRQIDEVLEKYDRWLEEKEEHDKRQRKRA